VTFPFNETVKARRRETKVRTVFEDVDAAANQRDAKANDRGKYVPLMLWIFALCFSYGSWRAYYWAYNRKPPEPPPPPVSLQDAKQIGQLAQKFNSFIQDGNWAEAQKLLSTEAQQRLTAENTTLQASMLGTRQNEKVALASTVQTDTSGDAPSTVRQDCLFRMQDAKDPNKITDVIIPLTIVIEGIPPNDRLAISNWKDLPPPTPGASPAAAATPANP
jgi:hypothetical protein